MVCTSMLSSRNDCLAVLSSSHWRITMFVKSKDISSNEDNAGVKYSA
ncbi:hypothetical protein CEXT_481301, partial [Caerostris extrusa]